MMGKDSACAVHGLINEQIRMAWFEIGLRLWRKGRKKKLIIV
jgi:hypothetical protein